ncbi:hypothetical protein [Marinomonas sp. 2405UD68-3]|uniref:hypothetical protein n=1 Tax=Marinomonas sp. 2405UD68-3 TaxID=3391835 RepID=UPI0039C8D971
MKIGFVGVMCIVLFGCASSPSERITQRERYYLPLVQSDVKQKSSQNIRVQQMSDRPKYSSPVRSGKPVNHATYSPVVQ